MYEIEDLSGALLKKSPWLHSTSNSLVEPSISRNTPAEDMSLKR